MSTLYIDSFDKKRKNSYQKLINFSDEFVLAGGTAIMLLTNFRKSFDFDLFLDKPLKRNLLSKAKKVFGDDMNVQIDNSNLLLFTTANGVKVDFVYYPYPPIHKIIVSKPISLFDLKDLASNKAQTIGRRAAWRDYVDMFFLVKEFGLDLIIKEAKQRYGGEFSEKLFLGQLVYYDDLEITPIKLIEKNYATEEIQKYLQDAVKKYTKRKIGEC